MTPHPRFRAVTAPREARCSVKDKMKIPEIKLTPTPKSIEGRDAVGYKWNNVAGTRHKLGGEPDWLGSEEIPPCPDCGKSMTFYGQLDSIGDDFDLADCGIIFVFVYFDCFTTKSIGLMCML